MAEPARRLIIPLLLATSLAFVECAFAQTAGRDPLGAARDLYASARYDEALAALNAPDTATADRKSVEQYRSLCLLALGRGSEAENAIAAVITADPTYQPKEEDASPRVRKAFTDVRTKILPQIATERYAAAKALFDKKMFAAAAQQFKNVIKLIDDPDMSGREADLRQLASGFLDLALAASAPPPAPEPAKPAASAVPPVAAPPPPPKMDPLRVYSIADHEVTPPVILRQDMPSLTPIVKLQASDHGVVEIVIDQAGRVEAVTMRQSVHPRYDAQVLAAAQNWRYAPATANGQPVRYRKMIQINISK